MYEKEMAKGNRKGMIFWAVFVPTFVINFVLFVVPNIQVQNIQMNIIVSLPISHINFIKNKIKQVLIK